LLFPTFAVHLQSLPHSRAFPQSEQNLGKFAVRFAFIMSIPAVLGSVVFKLDDIVEMGMEPGMLVPGIAGFLTAAVSGYLAIILVRLLMKKNSFRYFSVYCAVVGIVAVIANLI
jgi:undecaprenyl-diphosphatase